MQYAPTSTSPSPAANEHHSSPLLSPHTINLSNDLQLLEETVLAVKSLHARFDIFTADIDARFNAFRGEVLERLTEVEKAPVTHHVAVKDELQAVRQLMTQKALEIGEHRLETREERVERILETCRPRSEGPAEVRRVNQSLRPATSGVLSTTPVMEDEKLGSLEYSQLFATPAPPLTQAVSDTQFAVRPRRPSASKRPSLPSIRSRYRALASPYKRLTPTAPQIAKVLRKNIQNAQDRDYPRGVQRAQTHPTLPRLKGLAASFPIARSNSSSDLEPKARDLKASLPVDCNPSLRTAKRADDSQTLNTHELNPSAAGDSSHLLSGGEHETESEVMLTSIVLPSSS